MPSADRSMKPSCDSASIQRLASASQPARACEIAVTPPGPKSRPVTSATRCHVTPSLVVQIPRFGSADVPSDPTSHSLPPSTVPVSASRPRAGAGTFSQVVPSRDRMNRASTCRSSPANEPAGPTAMNHSPTCQMLVTSGWLPMSCSAQSRLATGVVVGDVVTTGDGDVVGSVADADGLGTRTAGGVGSTSRPPNNAKPTSDAPAIRPIASASLDRSDPAPRRIRRVLDVTARAATRSSGSTATGTRSAYLPSASIRRVSKGLGSVMVEVGPKAFEQARESRPDPGGRAAELGGDLGRIRGRQRSGAR